MYLFIYLYTVKPRYNDSQGTNQKNRYSREVVITVITCGKMGEKMLVKNEL